MAFELGMVLLIIRRDNCAGLVLVHKQEASRYQQVADSEIRETVTAKALGNDHDHVCRWVEWQISEDDLREERRKRAVARRSAAYHLALSGKYARAAWRPWLALAPDPPEPG